MKSSPMLRLASSHNWFSYKFRNFIKKKSTRYSLIASGIFIIAGACVYSLYRENPAPALVAKLNTATDTMAGLKVFDNDIISATKDDSTQKFSIDLVTTHVKFWNGKPSRLETKVEGKMLLRGMPGDKKSKNDIYFTNAPTDTVLKKWGEVKNVTIEVKSLTNRNLPKTYTGYLSDFMFVLAGISKEQWNEATFRIEKTE